MSVELPQEMDPLLLAAATCDNEYAQAAVGYYHEAVQAYEEGRDLGIYLHAIMYGHKTAFGTRYKGLGDEAIELVLAGRGQPKTEYNQRLGYAEDPRHDPLMYLHSKNKPPTLVEQYREEGEQAKKNFKEAGNWVTRLYALNSDSIDLSMQGRKIAGLNLDKTFDSQGRRVGQMELINVAMARLGLSLDQPDMAQHFVSLLPAQKRGELYFEAIRCTNQAGAAVLEQLGDLRTELESDTYAYCEFLIQEIAELHASGAVDVDKNTGEVLTLLSDTTLFRKGRKSSKLAHLFEDMAEARFERLPDRSSLQAALNAALAKVNRLDLLIATDQKSLEEGRETAMQLGWLNKAEKQQLTRREVRRLRKAARSIARILPSITFTDMDTGQGGREPSKVILEPNAKNLSAILALGITDDKRSMGYTTATPRVFIEKNAQLFLRGPSDELARAYKRHFPLQALEAGTDRLGILTVHTNLQAQPEAEALYAKIIENPKRAPASKLLAAVAMAQVFREESTQTVQLEAQCITELDRLLLEAVQLRGVNSLPEKSQRRQELKVEVETIEAKINQIPLTRHRQPLLIRVKEIGAQLG